MHCFLNTKVTYFFNLNTMEDIENNKEGNQNSSQSYIFDLAIRLIHSISTFSNLLSKPSHLVPLL